MGTCAPASSKPIFRAASASIAPHAASNPKAEPPPIITALAFCTMFSGRRRSVSRVAGAPPRTSTAHVAPPAQSPRATNAVQPVIASRSVKWPAPNSGRSKKSAGEYMAAPIVGVLLGVSGPGRFDAQARTFERQTPGARNSVICAIAEFRSEELPEDARACATKRSGPLTPAWRAGYLDSASFAASQLAMVPLSSPSAGSITSAYISSSSSSASSASVSWISPPTPGCTSSSSSMTRGVSR